MITQGPISEVICSLNAFLSRISWALVFAFLFSSWNLEASPPDRVILVPNILREVPLEPYNFGLRWYFNMRRPTEERSYYLADPNRQGDRFLFIDSTTQNGKQVSRVEAMCVEMDTYLECRWGRSSLLKITTMELSALPSADAPLRHAGFRAKAQISDLIGGSQVTDTIPVFSLFE